MQLHVHCVKRCPKTVSDEAVIDSLLLLRLFYRSYWNLLAEFLLPLNVRFVFEIRLCLVNSEAAHNVGFAFCFSELINVYVARLGQVLCDVCLLPNELNGLEIFIHSVCKGVSFRDADSHLTFALALPF